MLVFYMLFHLKTNKLDNINFEPFIKITIQIWFLCYVYFYTGLYVYLITPELLCIITCKYSWIHYLNLQTPTYIYLIDLHDIARFVIRQLKSIYRQLDQKHILYKLLNTKLMQRYCVESGAPQLA